MNARWACLRRSRAALGLLLACLVLGAWLAALHPIVHLREDAGHTHETGSLKQLLGAHGDAADCLVFDHLCHGDGLAAAAQALPAAVPLLAPIPLRLAQALLRPAPPFHARAPPPLLIRV